GIEQGVRVFHTVAVVERYSTIVEDWPGNKTQSSLSAGRNLRLRRAPCIIPTGKPPPLAVRLEQALPFRRCVGGEDVLWGSPASQTTQKPQAQYHGETRSSGVVPRRVPSLNEECALTHPLQGASFLSTPYGQKTYLT